MVEKEQKIEKISKISNELIVASQSVGLSSETALRIIRELTNPIRDIKNPDLQMGLIAAEISSISSAYGARYNVSENVLSACIDLCVNQFSKLSIHELKIAFELCASQKIDANTIVWGGIFDATLFGKVIWSYIDVRNRLVSQYEKLLPLKNVEIVEINKKKELALQSMKKQYFELVESCKFSNLSDLEQNLKRDEICQSSLFPFWFLSTDLDFGCNYQNFLFINKKVLISENVKNSLVEKTKIYVRNSYLKDFSNENNDKRIAAKREIHLLDEGKKTEKYFAKSKSVFFRFVVLHFIINPEEVNLF